MALSHTDGYLIVRVRCGDLAALGELYEKYQTMVYRTAAAITRDEKAAEDILQEVFIRIYTHAEEIDENRPVGPWLYRVTVNLSYSWTTRLKRWLHTLQDAFEHLTSPAQRSLESLAEEREWRHRVLEAVDALPSDQRTVVILHYMEGLGLAEIAYILEVPEGTIKSRLHYARESLRKILIGQDRGIATEVAYDFT